jgi:nickel-type superoxide dismutase maturation protease
VSATRRWGWTFVALGTAAVAAAAVSRRLDVVEVRGNSMAPTLRPGDRLVVMRLDGLPRVGEMILTGDPRDTSRELVKRVAAVGRGGVDLRGDNPGASTDGRTFGPVPAPAIHWRVRFRYWPLARVGRAGLARVDAPSGPHDAGGLLSVPSDALSGPDDAGELLSVPSDALSGP